MIPFEDRYIDNGGVRIHYEVEGEGLPLVLMHGMGMSTKDWRNAGYPERLSGEFQVILIDSRGFGQSQKLSDPEQYSRAHKVSDVTAVLDDLGIDTAYYWGYSMGASIGWACGMLRPDRFRGLILGAYPVLSPDVPEIDRVRWEARAKGWIKVLQTDVWVTLVLLTCATLPFYILGAGVLRARGLEPEGLETISVLSEMFTQTLGPWSLWLFGIGAFCILFSTMLSGVAGGARYIPDYIMELGYMRRRNLAGRRAWIRGYSTAATVIAFVVYVTIPNPVLLVTIGALTLALLLPIQSGAVLWFHKHRMDPRVRPGPWIRRSIWAIFLFELGMSGLVISYVVF